MGLFDKFLKKEEIDDGVPTVTPEASGDFHFVVEDVFTIIGRGTVVTGRVDSGTIKVGEIVYINDSLSAEIVGVEMFRKTIDYAQAGDNCGLLLKDVTKEDINRGDILTKTRVF